MSKYVLALDQGTEVSRAILFDDDGNVVSEAKREVPLRYPRQGWAEQEPMEIWSSQYAAMMEAVAKSGIRPEELAALGIANQRETTILWEKATGRPIGPAISWQCRRTAPLVQRLMEKGYEEQIRRVTGLLPDAYFSATKIQWLLDQVPDARQRAEKGEVLFGTVDSWLLWKLTGGRVHATDTTNASRTMLFDLERLDWDDTLLTAMDIPRAMLPQVFPSSHLYGTTRIHGVDVPIAAIAGDQQAALFGQCCFEKGQAKNTYDSGCFLLMNTGGMRVESRKGLLTSLACGREGEAPRYILEGSVFVGAGAIEWLRDGLHLMKELEDAEYDAQRVPDNGGVYLVPAFSGLGAPYWDMYARGCIVGLSRGTRREHLLRAAQESAAYQSADLVQAMEEDSGIPISELRVDGDAAENKFLMQFQASILDRQLRCSQWKDAAALGAAYLAGLAVGLWRDTRQLAGLWSGGVSYSPMMEDKTRRHLLHQWHRAVNRSRDWEEQEA